MIQLTITNKFSERYGQSVTATLADWESDSFWVPVRIGDGWRDELLIARRNLN